MKSIVSWHEMVVQSYEMVIPCHETTISSYIPFAEAVSCYDNRLLDVGKATVGMMGLKLSVIRERRL